MAFPPNWWGLMPNPFKATLNLEKAHQITSAFPNGEWRSIDARIFIADRGDQIHSNWRAAEGVDKMGGVYAILLPVSWFSKPTTIPLHAPHSHKGEKIPYEFTVESVTDGGFGVVYFGRTSNLLQRWRGHFSRGKFGLVDCGLYHDVETALRALRANARILYFVLDGPANCANRDVLEMSLCARFAPPFNIKSEH